MEKNFVKKLEFEAPEESSGTRIDLFLANKNIDLSRSRIQKLISQQNILVNGKPTKPSYKIKGNEKITIKVPPLEKLSLEPENIPLDILYEDSDLLVVNKKAGMVVHPALGNYSHTLVNALLFHCKDLSGINGVLRPGIVHRLDKNTSGLLVVAKNDFAHLSLAEQIKNRTLLREYVAIVWGHMPTNKGIIEAPIGRSTKDRKKMTVTRLKGRESLTEYRVLERFDLCDLLSIRLKTGRTHQIRVHLSYLNHPVLGDPEYGGRQKWIKGVHDQYRLLAQRLLSLIDRQALHAKKLGFIHPRTKEYKEFESPMPEDIENALSSLRKSGLP
ncbi:MAG: RluA family pseudouridine synthase [candidate division Zixibacteria bacterium]|nr:RluA family pseudouridine synthase [candidate division Zixibacteria bacterium]